ncbi:Peptidase family U32 [compost metagenome]
MKSVDYNAVAIRAYRTAMDAYYANPSGYEFRQEWLDAVEEVQPVNRPLSYGFYYKEQVY